MKRTLGNEILDYARLRAFLVGFGGAAIFIVHSLKILLLCCIALLVQFVLVRHAAATYGPRFVGEAGLGELVIDH
jgi:hypothetical protein